MGSVSAGQMVIDVLLNTTEGRAAIESLEAEVKRRGLSMEEALKNLKLKFDTTPLDQAVKKSGAARMGMMQLAYGMQDASYIFVNTRMGLMGISNNLDMLIQSMVMAKAEAAAMKMGFGELLMNTLKGPTGLIVGFSILMGVIQAVTFSMDSGKKKTQEYNTELKKLRGTLNDLTVAQLESSRASLEAQRNAVLAEIAQKKPKNFMEWIGLYTTRTGGILRAQASGIDEQIKPLDDKIKAYNEEIEARLKESTGQVGQLQTELDDIVVALKHGNLTMAERISLLKRQSELQKEIKGLTQEESEKQTSMKDGMEDYYKTVKQEEQEMNRERRIAAELVMDQYKRQELTAGQAKQLLEAYKYQITDQETLNVLANDIYNIDKNEAELMEKAARDRERQANEVARQHQEELRDLNDLITSADYLGATLEEALGRGNSETAKWIGLLRAALQIWRSIIAIQEASNSAQETAGTLNLLSNLIGAAIPFLDSGGVITHPTLAVVGERRKEIVQPLDDYLAMASYGTSDVVVGLRRVEEAVGNMQINLVGVERLRGGDLVTGLRDVGNRKRSYAI